MNKEERIAKYIDLFENSQLAIPVEDLDDIGFFTAPASTKYHGAYEGGLFDHSAYVAETLIDLTERLELTWIRPESPIIIGLYHDLCKCDQYVKDPETGKYVYQDTILPGHGDKSIAILSQFLTLTSEEITCIRWHMGAFEDDPKLRSGYARACERYENVLFTHTADMIASMIEGI